MERVMGKVKGKVKAMETSSTEQQRLQQPPRLLLSLLSLWQQSS
jgi:hypothetical protein